MTRAMLAVLAMLSLSCVTRKPVITEVSPRYMGSVCRSSGEDRFATTWYEDVLIAEIHRLKKELEQCSE